LRFQQASKLIDQPSIARNDYQGTPECFSRLSQASVNAKFVSQLSQLERALNLGQSRRSTFSRAAIDAAEFEVCVCFVEYLFRGEFQFINLSIKRTRLET
jgi:hypothetical protein